MELNVLQEKENIFYLRTKAVGTTAKNLGSALAEHEGRSEAAAMQVLIVVS